MLGNSEMTISEVIEQKERLQEKISIALEEFREACDFYPDSIEVDFTNFSSFGEPPTRKILFSVEASISF